MSAKVTMEVTRADGVVMLYVRLGDGAAHRTVEISNEVNVDFGQHGEVIGIEVITDAPNKSPDPPPPARPETEALLSWCQSKEECTPKSFEPLRLEVIRRVRVHDDALRAVRATEHLGHEAQALALAVRAILEGDGA